MQEVAGDRLGGATQDARVRRVEAVFDEDESRRREHGAQRHWVYRTVEDPNDVVVAVEFPSVDAARAFVQDPGLRDAMGRGGVQGEPHVHLRDEVEAVEY
jgi:heme-degrading monooxygenase HmoA